MRLTIILTAFLVVSQLAPGGLARGEDEEAGKKPPARPNFKNIGKTNNWDSSAGVDRISFKNKGGSYRGDGDSKL